MNANGFQPNTNSCPNNHGKFAGRHDMSTLMKVANSNLEKKATTSERYRVLAVVKK